MLYYETLVLTATEASADTIASLEKAFGEVVTGAKGTVAAIDRWGKHRLAYPIRKQSFGNYTLIRYSLEQPGDFFTKVDTLLKVKYNDQVMRHVHVKLEKEAFEASYYKPDSVDQERERASFSRGRDGRNDRGDRNDRPAREAATERTAEEVVVADTADAETVETTPEA